MISDDEIETNQQNSPIAHLPTELIDYLNPYLDDKNRTSAAQVSKFWHSIFSWKGKIIREFGIAKNILDNLPSDIKVNFQKCYVALNTWTILKKCNALPPGVKWIDINSPLFLACAMDDTRYVIKHCPHEEIYIWSLIALYMQRTEVYKAFLKRKMIKISKNFYEILWRLDYEAPDLNYSKFVAEILQQESEDPFVSNILNAVISCNTALLIERFKYGYFQHTSPKEEALLALVLVYVARFCIRTKNTQFMEHLFTFICNFTENGIDVVFENITDRCLTEAIKERNVDFVNLLSAKIDTLYSEDPNIYDQPEFYLNILPQLAAERGDIDGMRLLLNPPFNFTASSKLADSAARSGNINMLHFLHKSAEGPQLKPDQTAVTKAAENGRLKALQWLLDPANNFNLSATLETLNAAALSGNLPIYQWLRSKFNLQPNAETVDNASTSGNLEMLKAIVTPDLRPTQLTISKTEAIGALECLKWLMSPDQMCHIQFNSQDIVNFNMSDQVAKWFFSKRKTSNLNLAELWLLHPKQEDIASLVNKEGSFISMDGLKQQVEMDRYKGCYSAFASVVSNQDITTYEIVFAVAPFHAYWLAEYYLTHSTSLINEQQAFRNFVETMYDFVTRDKEMLAEFPTLCLTFTTLAKEGIDFQLAPQKLLELYEIAKTGFINLDENEQATMVDDLINDFNESLHKQPKLS